MRRLAFYFSRQVEETPRDAELCLYLVFGDTVVDQGKESSMFGSLYQLLRYLGLAISEVLGQSAPVNRLGQIYSRLLAYLQEK